VRAGFVTGKQVHLPGSVADRRSEQRGEVRPVVDAEDQALVTHRALMGVGGGVIWTQERAGVNPLIAA